MRQSISVSLILILTGCSSLPDSYTLLIRREAQSFDRNIRMANNIESVEIFKELPPFIVTSPYLESSRWNDASRQCRELSVEAPCFIWSNCAIAHLMSGDGNPSMEIAKARQLCPDSSAINANFRTILALHQN